MIILHYFLGFPPYRSGGLTKYVMDLMETQVEDGNRVLALWPGKMKFFSSKVSIKKRKLIGNIESYEIINPLPVPLDEGIKEIDEFIKPCDMKVYMNFVMNNKPDVVHIHTLMGIHKEFIEVLNHLGIRCVYTSHDYFGICPKVNLYCEGKPCENNNDYNKCVKCNKNALSINKIRVMQSPIYRRVKESKLIKAIRKKHRNTFFEENESEICDKGEDIEKEGVDKYKKLRQYYVNMYEMIDCIHYNSMTAKQIFGRYVNEKDSRVITITHKGIKDNRECIKYCPEEGKIRLTMLAPARPYKGYYVLKKALDELWEEGSKKFVLNIFGKIEKPSPYMNIVENGFTHEQFEEIFDKTDVVIAPSIWYETFGFTVLEALSYGIPVIISENVGAKDIAGNGAISVVAGDVNDLKEKISKLTKSKLIKMHNEILKTKIKLWEEFVGENYELYRQERS